MRQQAQSQPTIARPTRRVVNVAVNAAIHQLQLADEAVDEHHGASARANLKTAREAIDQALAALKGYP